MSTHDMMDEAYFLFCTKYSNVLVVRLAIMKDPNEKGLQ